MTDVRDADRPRRARSRVRRGTTLIELLMVIFIISVILGLLIPALQAGREAAMRVQCTNNLKQLALALHNYEAVLGVLPPGVVNPTGPIANRPDDLHIGWYVQLLPYMEQGGVALAFDTRLSVYDPVNATGVGSRISALRCPNDPVPPFPTTPALGAGAAGPPPPPAVWSSYAASHHDVEAPIDADNHGLFFLNSAIRQADIEDGSSFTLMVAEKRSDEGDLGWASGTRASLRNTGSPLRAGPRRPSELFDPTPDDDLRVGGFGSWHDRIVNAAFADGSVRFLSVTISPKVLRLLGHRADGEPIGANDY